jgi:hypothetical protein
MLVKEMNAALSPFKLLCAKNALAPQYKALELSPNKIRGCSTFGRAEVMVATGVPTVTYVDAWTFINVVHSLPGDAALEFATDGNVLNWKAGASRGRLAQLTVADMPGIADEEGSPYQPDPDFVNSLTLGALSSGDTAMATVGAFGVVIDATGDLPAIMSTDNTTMSCCYFKPATAFKLAKPVTLSPDAVALLGSQINTKGLIAFAENNVHYVDDWIELVVTQVPPLTKNLKAIVAGYNSANTCVKIAPEAISAFVKRAGALAESKRDTHVVLSASNGQLGLSFSQGAASADEVYLVESLQLPNVAEIHLDGAKLARALQNVDHLVLDHIDRGVLVLRGGKDNCFHYLISGKKSA